MQGTRTAPILRWLGLKRAHISASNSRSGKAVVGGQVVSIGITDRELTTGHSQLLLYGSGGGRLKQEPERIFPHPRSTGRGRKLIPDDPGRVVSTGY